MIYFKKYWFTFFIMFVVLLLGGFYTYYTLYENNDFSNKQTYKDFVVGENEEAYTNLDGETIELADLVDEITVVNSWASWSPSSANELIILSEIANKFKDKNVRVIAINRSEPRNTAKRFLSSIGAIENVKIILDPDDKYFNIIKGYNMPETVIYDSDGNISAHIIGSFDKKKLINQIEELLKEEN